MNVMTRICMKKDVGLNGILFGGIMLSFLDEAAYIYAKKMTAEKHLVTLRFGEIIFRHPVQEGDMIEFYVDDKKTKKGKTSITFPVSALVEGKEVFKTEATFVAIDENGNKKEIAWK